MIAAVYARKSTSQNGIAEDQKSVARQIDQARGFAAAKGWTINEDTVFVDDGISGAEHERRPGFVALLAAVERGPSFDVLLVADLTRLSRDNRKLDKYVSMIDEAGVKLWTVEDGAAGWKCSRGGRTRHASTGAPRTAAKGRAFAATPR